jgi:RHS repeat-associated protein
VAFLVDNAGQPQERYTCDVFGKPTITDAGGTECIFSWYNHAFLFQGREYIRELGVYDYRHRFYHPGLGRFIQIDPMGVQTEGAKLSAEQAALYPMGGAPEIFSSSELNLYRYCNSNPVNNSDPLGLEIIPYTGPPIPVDMLRNGAGLGATGVDPVVVTHPEKDGNHAPIGDPNYWYSCRAKSKIPRCPEDPN